MQPRTRTLLVTTVATIVVVAVALVLIARFAPGTREVPRAMDGDEPGRELTAVADQELADLDAALVATFSQGSAHLRYRQRTDGELNQIGVGRIDFDLDRATVGIAGTHQIFAGDVAYLRFGQQGPFMRVEPAELSSARGEPTPGASSPWDQLELVARADDAHRIGTTTVSGIELARVAAIADVTAARDNIAHDLAALADQFRADPAAFDDAFVDLDTVEALLAHMRGHDGELPIEVWVDADQRIWRLSYDMADWNPAPSDGAPEIGMFALDLRGFGTAGGIELPDDDDEVLDPDEAEEMLPPGMADQFDAR